MCGILFYYGDEKISVKILKQALDLYGAENYILEKENIEKIFNSNLVRELLDKNVSIQHILKTDMPSDI